MLVKNKAGGVYLLATDTTAAPYGPKTGDASNITGFYSLDGAAQVSGFTTTHPTEIGHGVYWQPLTAAETNADMASYAWVSSTTGIVLQPAFPIINNPPGVRKNTALANFVFPMIQSNDHVTRASGKTVAASVSIDGAAFVTAANAVSEIGSTGFYKLNLAAADLNGATILFLASASACDDTEFLIATQP